MPPSLGLDHVYVRVHDLDVLLAFFQGVLRLPLSWPVRDETFARYAWVNAGNVQLELWQARSNDDLPSEATLPCIAGVALWPQHVEQSRQQLDTLGIACEEPKTWRTRTPDGELADNFTNCLVAGASSPACQVFFCAWNPDAPIVPWPKGESTSCRRERFAAELTSSGGDIGLVGLHTLHMQSSDPAETAHAWLCLTGEHHRAAPGIALALAEGPQMCITALVFRVRDLPAAASALEEQGVQTCNDATVLWIDHRATHGLRIGLSDR